jgi:hypothetical protein
MARGRRQLYGEPTVTLRVPVSQVEAVRHLLDASVLSVLRDWQQRASGKSRQPRWQHVCAILAELSAVLDSPPSDSSKPQ